MYYIITESWHIVKQCETERGAKLSLKRKYAAKYPDQHLRIMSAEEFHATEPMVETFNLKNGKKLMIRASEKGGCCDPGTETYWSM